MPNLVSSEKTIIINTHPEIRMVAGGACNLPNALILPFRIELHRLLSSSFDV